MKECLIENLYTLENTIATSLFKDVTYPWEVLPKIHDYILELGKTLPKDQYDEVEENVWIAKTAMVEKTACVKGPAIICEQAEIRHCAFIRGNVIVGKNTVVGNSTELKNAILFDNVQVPHYNYVGDSILGYKAHMGAGAIASNVKPDRKNIVIKNLRTGENIETNIRKVGAMIGDNVEVGCGAILNPGSIIGKATNIYPLSSVRGVIEKNSIYKNQNEIICKKEIS